MRHTHECDDIYVSCTIIFSLTSLFYYICVTTRRQNNVLDANMTIPYTRSLSAIVSQKNLSVREKKLLKIKNSFVAQENHLSNVCTLTNVKKSMSS